MDLWAHLCWHEVATAATAPLAPVGSPSLFFQEILQQVGCSSMVRCATPTIGYLHHQSCRFGNSKKAIKAEVQAYWF